MILREYSLKNTDNYIKMIKFDIIEIDKDIIELYNQLYQTMPK